MAILSIENIEFHSYHGIYDIEKKIGNKFLIDLKIEIPIIKSSLLDDVSYSIDYQELLNVIKKEMQIPSNTLENLLHRIIKQIFNKFNNIKWLWIKIHKVNPMVEPKIKSFSIEWEGSKESFLKNDF